MNRFIAVVLFTLSSLSYSYSAEVMFAHNNANLSGHYLENTNDKPTKAVLIFVHGDGAMSYDADGYYNLIWEPLRANGYAIFSWDKPGVGNSTGNWLNQTMTERQSEVLAAVEFVQQQYHFTDSNTGLMGFSQAGWVLPALSKQNAKVGFVIGVGFATNWIEQGEYYTAVNRQLEGGNSQQIQQALTQYKKEITFLKQSPSYAEYSNFAGEEAMDQDRFEFVLNNFKSDAKQDYLSVRVPSLYLWGEKDLNVDAKKEFEYWQNNENHFVTPMLIANASHAMLKADKFDHQSFGALQWLKLMWLEQEAFAESFLPTILTWLDELKLEPPTN
ncbi:alpha/beta hydrolase family protein [Vibrio mexicanus]|uniref:alpha/beta hydrolase family protein n=1 Tax=Vibrio mexicanus TaxID=1004326 RepID=UPI00063CC967|nr:alpha/beta hydrolase [Vibrio mexicanus]